MKCRHDNQEKESLEENLVFFKGDLSKKRTPVKKRIDYYPGGLVLRETKDEPYRFGYQGQFAEMDSTTGWNHFQLRQYDAVTWRWNSVDPYRQYYSPYIGMGNNPIYYVDPDGGCAVGDTPCIQAAQAAGFTSQGDINAFLNANIQITAPKPSKISLFDALIAALYRSEAWVNSFSGPDNSWDGKHGIAFFSTTDLNGEPQYWIRNGKIDYAIEDAGNGLVAFKGGNGRMYRLDLKTPNGSSNTNRIKQVSAALGYGSQGIKILTNIVKQLSQVHGGPQSIVVESDYVPDTTFWEMKGNGYKVKGMVIKGVEMPGDTIRNN